jgi:hypothetical protein
MSFSKKTKEMKVHEHNEMQARDRKRLEAREQEIAEKASLKLEADGIVTLGDTAEDVPLLKRVLIGFKHVMFRGEVLEFPLIISHMGGSLRTHLTWWNHLVLEEHPKEAKALFPDGGSMYPPLGGDTYLLPQPSYSVFANFYDRDLDRIFKMESGHVHLGYEVAGAEPIKWTKKIIQEMADAIDERDGTGMMLREPKVRKAKA